MWTVTLPTDGLDNKSINGLVRFSVYSIYGCLTRNRIHQVSFMFGLTLKLNLTKLGTTAEYVKEYLSSLISTTGDTVYINLE